MNQNQLLKYIFRSLKYLSCQSLELVQAYKHKLLTFLLAWKFGTQYFHLNSLKYLTLACYSKRIRISKTQIKDFKFKV
ncbi:hypothetical protein [Cryptosporidium hominis TU502]|uniref:hypothetical protein n=1 Tax=Cryptosporidium hominis (strain TU502) TaxID=353151 RepID=UPI00004533CA|nr:hypothetical protein [Cryptosporidium hominis TU502]